MESHNYFIVSAIIFILAGSLHLVRSLMGWELVISNFILPFWVSWLVVVILVYMIWQGFKLSRKR